MLYAAEVINTPFLRGALAVGSVLAVLTAAPAYAQRLDEVDIDLPDIGVTLHEQADDPKKVSAFSTRTRAYVRSSEEDSFVKKKGYKELTVSPKGGKVAGVPDTFAGNTDSVVIIDSATGKTRRIRTVRKPLETNYALWSRDERKLALTIEKKVGKKWHTIGFTLVDTVAGTAKAVMIPGVDKETSFEWTPDGRYLAATHHDGVRFYDPDGRVRRAYPKIGTLAGAEDAFSPSGKQMVTWCPSRYTEMFCIWDTRSGKLANRVGKSAEDSLGWWDDRHLISLVKEEGGYQVVVVDLKGQVVRVLADVSSPAWKKDEVYLSYTPAS